MVFGWPIRTLVCLTVLGLALTGCGEPTTAEVETPAPATVTVTATATVESTSPTRPATPASPASQSAGPEVIMVDPGSTRTLTKADAFASQGWEEGSFQAVGGTRPEQALAARSHCGRKKSQPLEFRFAQNQGKIRFTVAHSMLSATSDAQLEWALLVDGRQVQTEIIAFKESAELVADLSGVAVVQVLYRQVQDSGCGDTLGLITSAVIEG